MLESARFIGDPVLEACLAGRHRMLRPQQGPAVRKVQQALLDLGYDLGPRRDDGLFGRDTGAAVTLFKTRREIVPNDPVVGPKTMAALDAEFALPFADREEWLSWRRRPLRQWNFTREDELFRHFQATPFRFSAESQWVPTPFRNAIVAALTALLDPFGSPDGVRTPSATWGVSPLDLYHCHIIVDEGIILRNPDFGSAKIAAREYEASLERLRRQATSTTGREGTPAWTREYRTLLLASGTPQAPSVRDNAARVLNMTLAASRQHNIPVTFLWHSFEVKKWRPATMGSTDPRRHWLSFIPPIPGGVTHAPFTELKFIGQVLDLGFLVDPAGAITVMAGTLDEVSAVVDLSSDEIRAAALGPTAPVPVGR
jgi:Putative peptidoglycan binding domain